MPIKTNLPVFHQKTSFQKIVKFRKLFKFPNSISPTENDLVSSRLWDILATYQFLFQYMHPFGILVFKRKIYVRNCSFLKRVFLKFSFLLLISFTIVTSLLLLNRLLSSRTKATSSLIEISRTLVMLYVTFLFPSFIPTSVTINFGPGLVCQIVNPIVDFGPRIRGKLKYIKRLV